MTGLLANTESAVAGKESEGGTGKEMGNEVVKHDGRRKRKPTAKALYGDPGSKANDSRVAGEGAKEKGSRGKKKRGKKANVEPVAEESKDVGPSSVRLDNGQLPKLIIKRMRGE